MLKPVHLARTDLNLLVLFEVVLQERHVGRAAERLSLSASAVSHGLRRLRRLLNDPLFLRTPRGVVPTARATELAAPIADILARTRSVITGAKPFDAGSSSRRFTIGAPDAVSAVLLPGLLTELRTLAPHVDIGVTQLLPAPGVSDVERAWATAVADLETRSVDIAILPLRDAPARFAQRTLYHEDFVVAMRTAHPFARDPGIDRFCRLRHVLVSSTGDAHGFVDEVLATQNRSRRVGLTVSNFMLALTLVAQTDMVAAVPRRLVAIHAKRFGLISRELPFSRKPDPVRAIAPKAAMMDAGVAWLFDVLGKATAKY